MKDAFIIAIACIIAIGAGLWLYAEGEKGAGTEAAAISVLYKGDNSGALTERKNYRIKTREELNRLWQMMYQSDGPTLPDIDFTKYEVLAVFDGTHSTGGYGVEVVSVEDKETARHITLLRTSPGDSCMTSQAFSSPFVLVTLSKSTLPIVREEIEEVRECR